MDRGRGPLLRSLLLRREGKRRLSRRPRRGGDAHTPEGPSHILRHAHAQSDRAGGEGAQTHCVSTLDGGPRLARALLHQQIGSRAKRRKSRRGVQGAPRGGRATIPNERRRGRARRRRRRRVRIQPRRDEARRRGAATRIGPRGHRRSRRARREDARVSVFRRETHERDGGAHLLPVQLPPRSVRSRRHGRRREGRPGDSRRGAQRGRCREGGGELRRRALGRRRRRRGVSTRREFRRREPGEPPGVFEPECFEPECFEPECFEPEWFEPGRERSPRERLGGRGALARWCLGPVAPAMSAPRGRFRAVDGGVVGRRARGAANAGHGTRPREVSVDGRRA